MRFADLRDGLPVEYRIGRVADERTGRLEWDAWRPGTLRVQLRQADSPRGFRNQTKYWRRGEPCAIWVEGCEVEKRPDDVRELDDGTISLDPIDSDPYIGIRSPCHDQPAEAREPVLPPLPPDLPA